MRSGTFSESVKFSSEGAEFNQYGGTYLANIIFGSPDSDSSGQYTIYDGLAVSSAIDVGTGEFGHGNFTQYGGTVITASLALGGSRGRNQNYFHGRLSFSDANGVLQAAGIGIINGGITQAGGLLVTSNSVFVSGVPPVQYGPAYFASYSLSGGRLSSPGVGVGPFGSFSQSGGSNDIEGDLDVSGSDYGLSGGILISSNAQVTMSTQWDSFGFGPYEGGFQQTGGTNSIAGGLLLSGAEYALSGGVLLDYSEGSYPTVIVSTGVSGNQTNIFYGIFNQTGGLHRVANTLSNVSYTLGGGSLYASNIVLEGLLSVSNSAVILNPGLFQFAGTLQLYGGTIESLGQMSLSSNSVIELLPGSHQLSFLNSAAMNWKQTSSLLVSNWNGSTNGGGSDQLFFGNSRTGLTPAQLRQIVFVNPAGFPVGNYAANLLSSGEVVPLPNPVLSFQSVQGHLVFSWAGQPTLQSSTNILGPYVDVPNASSPYTNSSSQDPSRFFRLRR